jgi:hypothetical protein
VLHLRSGDDITIDPRYTGSDPNVVAPIIDYFLNHAESRDTLARSRAAIALVETAAAPIPGGD